MFPAPIKAGSLGSAPRADAAEGRLGLGAGFAPVLPITAGFDEDLAGAAARVLLPTAASTCAWLAEEVFVITRVVVVMVSVLEGDEGRSETQLGALVSNIYARCTST